MPGVFVLEMNDPETWPFDDTPQLCEVHVPGDIVTLQLTAADENPVPVNENCVPMVPDAGVTVIPGITVRLAETISLPGDPTT